MEQSEEEIRLENIRKSRNMEMISFVVWIAGILIIDNVKIADSRIEGAFLIFTMIAMVICIGLRVRRFILFKRK